MSVLQQKINVCKAGLHLRDKQLIFDSDPLICLKATLRSSFNSFIAMQNKIVFFKIFETNFRILRLYFQRYLHFFFPLFVPTLPIFLKNFELAIRCRSCGCSDNVRKAKLLRLQRHAVCWVITP